MHREIPKTLLGIFLVGALTCAQAQWLDHPDPRTPRTRDGKANLKASAPRRNGRPDLSGVWQAERPSLSEFVRVLGADAPKLQVDLLDTAAPVQNIFWGIKRGEQPLKPEALAVMAKRREAAVVFPPSRCLPVSVPGAMFVYAFKIVQTPEEIVMLTEAGDPPRQIFTDGRGLPKDPDPTWMGSSIGKWQGDTLVVETTGFKDDAWLDGAGHPRSESMHITERYRRDTFGHISLEMTFVDPKYYTRPFSSKASLNLLPDTDIFEFVCTENERDLPHIQPR